MNHIDRFIEYKLKEIESFSKRETTSYEANKYISHFSIDYILCRLWLSKTEKNIKIAEWIIGLFKEKLFAFRKNKYANNL